MYLSHFELQEKPFKISTDPKFLWLGEKHKEALATLLYGILYNDGFVVVTGDVGTGKTTLASALMAELAGKVIAVKVPFPDFESLDFFKLISSAYGIGGEFQTKGSFFALFESFLRKSASSGKKVVLIVDEAQRLTAEHLKELLHLSNIEENGARLLNVVFVGQNEFNGILLEEANRALRQRITISYNLCALSPEETGQYVAHRLQVAQGKKEIFPPDAVAEVFSFSGGIPRLINVACDLALLLTYFGGEKTVRAKTVKESAERLRLPSEKPAGKSDEARLDPAAEEADRIEIEGREGEEGKPGRENEEKKRGKWGKALYGGGAAILALGIGVFILVFQPDRLQRKEPPRETKSEEGPKEPAPFKETESARGENVREPAPAAAKETPAPPETAKTPEPARSQPEALVPAATQADKEPKVQAAPPKKKEGAAPRPTPRADRPAPSGAQRGKVEVRQAEKPPADGGRAILPEEKEKPDREPAPAPAREPAAASPEEVDPGKVIDWLIERRFDKR
jgi:type II secretory pathway predicted ATPase ExeA